ncbi:head-tail adaptor protein [Ketogulonicigenium vulgare]|uniref:Putative gene transfer agent head-tail adaptor n=1 Tax=Ketogulonicigenium vulgare (strain WSH-001) TaxID=759362 RepID=F9Y458_KETVW|nr:head-tail adaptor protein [Ketogulonicigenium vulgare]ADO42300.1 head-tail adaptor, putative [Ketogulonicigenium vulgare Y25]AEM40494.1 putative gene transfer agent head-tail adaptor [Ketogulonicigenium vulgare WSH-001]ALJ80679.1 phage tail protein [Ketogulonicigenium vulgare]ANW33487.1 phage tail protein [Ketogulonicigenium vulgare]AOZ54211.1 head-tail adaptor [Ketogulonicigenium vulgare]
MRPPRMNRALILQAPTRTPDGAGGYTQGWQTLGTLWAAVTPATGREAAALGAALARVPVRITLRAAPAGDPRRPIAGQRLTEGPRSFLILAVQETSARLLTCIAEEELVR